MANIPTCNVLCNVYDNDGTPLVGAKVTAKLNNIEIYNGYVIPDTVSATTDADGFCVLALWPNQLGATESSYDVKIVSPNGKTARVVATVPNVASASLHLISNVPPYEGKTDGQLIVDAAIAAVAPAVAAQNAATASATSASTSAAAASASAVSASGSAATATTRASEASTSATTASTQASNASSAATLAQDWATRTASEVVVGQGFGAKKYATDAATSATTASTSATNASTSATSASTSATTATTKATEAATSAANALSSANTATTNAATATTQATSASNYATTANNKATEATNSASAASSSASNAAISASAASGSASTAASQATSAVNSAINASTSASGASASATSATAQAGIATTKAAEAAASATTATTKAAEASTSATNASTSATSASGSATVATTKASEATASADSVQSAAVTATTNATTATTQAGIATTQAGIATTQATNAGNSATSAAASFGAIATQATNAANSATAAATSATNASTSATNAASSATTAVNAPGTSGTSTTSVTIPAVNNSITLTTQTGKAWVVGQFVTVSSTASPANFMYGYITAYNSGNGSMTVFVQTIGGSGTLASWSIGLSAPVSSVVVVQSDVGAAPNQIPLNQYLGDLAFMDIVDTISSNPYYDTAISDVQPTLNLDFVNAKTLDSRITFARASTATFYDAKSSAVAEQNFLLWSQNWANSPWTTIGAGTPVATANADVAPDGTTTATSLLFSAQFQNRSQTQTALVAGTVYTVSFYAKTISGNTALHILYDTGSFFTPITTTASWARYSFTFTATTTTAVGIFGLQDRNASGFGTTLVWGAQYEQRSAATAYTPTTTQAITNYIPTLQTAANNIARLDYDPITREPKGLLIEESRANLITYSEDFANAAWNDFRSSSLLSNAAVAPDGTLTADKLVEAAATATHFVQRVTSVTISSGTTYAVTLYAKAAGRNFLQILPDAAGGVLGGYTTIDLTNGTVSALGSGTTASVSAVGNGWYRCSFVATSSGTTARPGIGMSTDAGTGAGSFKSYTGDGFSGIFIWGIQIEAGAFPTSYIPTVASAVTRAADAASMTGTNFSSWYNQAQGTFYTEFVLPAYPENASINQVALGLGTANNDLFSGVVQIDGRSSVGYLQPTGASNIGTPVANTLQKVSVTSGNSQSAAINGTVRASSAFNRLYSYDRLGIGNWGRAITYQYPLNGYIRKITYYPVRLPNAELQEMTA